ncbi:MAG: hypothetical protein ACP5GU_01145 [Thermoprotei archaeon]|jgi:hypothetical protein
MNDIHRIYLENIRLRRDISKDYVKLTNIYKSVNLTLNDVRNISFHNSKLISIGIFMIAGVPEPIISDIIGLMILGLGSIFTKKESINDFVMNNFYSIKEELKDLFDFFIIDHHI